MRVSLAVQAWGLDHILNLGMILSLSVVIFKDRRTSPSAAALLAF